MSSTLRYPLRVLLSQPGFSLIVTSHPVSHAGGKTMAAAEERRRADIGYDGPSDYSSTLVHISAWSSAAGMQTYPENAPDTLLLAGEVFLVLDVALLPEPTVHASYAGSATEGRHS
jgi:hypothetical protein